VPEHYFSEKPTSKSKRGLIRCTLKGMELEFVTDSGVFSHTKIDNGTRLLIESMEIPESGSFLDLGCGYGPIGIVAAKIKPNLKVTMTDINSRAIALSIENVKRNHIGAVEVIQTALYELVRGRLFDTVVSNPPISAGMKDVVEPLVAGAAVHLKPGGLIQVVVQSNKGGKTLESYLESHFGNSEVLARGSGYRVLVAKQKN
jgi:16S rRNA (guanine1207-N2)-methyltransferase